eukprot:11787894-Alexandrium_andersonii.AAC.1
MDGLKDKINASKSPSQSLQHYLKRSDEVEAKIAQVEEDIEATKQQYAQDMQALANRTEDLLDKRVAIKLNISKFKAEIDALRSSGDEISDLETDPYMSTPPPAHVGPRRQHQQPG